MKERNGGKKTRGAPRVAAASPGARRPGQSRTLRIIGGRHRGRRLRFPEGVDIRPTPDRVRETLFNWLQPRMDSARVLDLFSGSGALGLEAISRGAAQVIFVEQDRKAAAAIEAILKDWGETSGSVVCTDAVGWLTRKPSPAPFEIVFLDPPYDSALLSSTAAALTPAFLAADARVYVERRANEPLAALPDTWKELRSGRAGEVGYHLFAI